MPRAAGSGAPLHSAQPEDLIMSEPTSGWRSRLPSNQPVRALVTTGIHGWSRNPIYVGMFLLYAGIGIAAPSPWVLILALPLVVILRYGVVAREEAYLERRFGDAYRDYKARVRRWL
jgi:protein-S-isoprenylcysteine O-methyltransferase Ste14